MKLKILLSMASVYMLLVGFGFVFMPQVFGTGAGAYILAGELKEAKGNYKTAYAQHQRIFKPFMDTRQKIAQSFSKSLVPKSIFGIWMRNMFMNLMFLPFLSRLFIKQFMNDKLKLKGY